MTRASKRIKRVQGGITTSNLILSAYVGNNDEVFPRILKLYVPTGSVVADVTYGKGVFWRRIPKNAYILKASDIETGVDCRKLPYEKESIDCVVLDPPYMEGLYRGHPDHMAGSGSHAAFWKNMYVCHVCKKEWCKLHRISTIF
jgi:hypothetical protein